MKTKLILITLFYSILKIYAQNECGTKDRKDQEFRTTPWY